MEETPKPSSSVKIECSCGFTLSVPDVFSDVEGICPKCKKTLFVPGTPAEQREDGTPEAETQPEGNTAGKSPVAADQHPQDFEARVDDEALTWNRSKLRKNPSILLPLGLLGIALLILLMVVVKPPWKKQDQTRIVIREKQEPAAVSPKPVESRALDNPLNELEKAQAVPADPTLMSELKGIESPKEGHRIKGLRMDPDGKEEENPPGEISTALLKGLPEMEGPVTGSSSEEMQPAGLNDKTPAETPPPELMPVSDAEKIIETWIQGKKDLPVKEYFTQQKVRGYTVTLASFKKKDLADKYCRELEGSGYEPFKWEIVLPSGTWCRVCLGYFSNRREAQRQAEMIREDRKIKTFVAEIRTSHEIDALPPKDKFTIRAKAGGRKKWTSTAH